MSELLDEHICGSSDSDVLLHLFNVLVPAGDRYYREHKHSKLEIAFFKSGSGVYSTKHRNYSINEHDVFVFSSNEQHCITKINDGGFHIMNLHIEPRYFWDSKQDMFSNPNLFFSHSDSFENRLPRNNEYTEKIIALLLSLEDELSQKNPEYALMVRSKIIELLVLLVRELGYSNDANTTNSNIRPLRRSLDYIQKHLTEDISLLDIADYAGMSRSYFSSYFYSIMGQRLWDYITEKRIEQAMQLIDENEYDTMMGIATKCGFNNTANFNKAFKKHTGGTPSQYKSSGKAALY